MSKEAREVILILERQPPSNIVKLDFTTPNSERLISYRAYYHLKDLCLDYDSGVDEVTVKQFWL